MRVPSVHEGIKQRNTFFNEERYQPVFQHLPLPSKSTQLVTLDATGPHPLPLTQEGKKRLSFGRDNFVAVYHHAGNLTVGQPFGSCVLAIGSPTGDGMLTVRQFD